MRRAAKRDTNEPEIVQALEGVGCSVERLSAPGVPDLLVAFRGAHFLIECKMPGETLTPAQKRWHWAWNGKVSVVRTVDEALAAVGLKPAAKNEEVLNV